VSLLIGFIGFLGLEDSVSRGPNELPRRKTGYQEYRRQESVYYPLKQEASFPFRRHSNSVLLDS